MSKLGHFVCTHSAFSLFGIVSNVEFKRIGKQYKISCISQLSDSVKDTRGILRSSSASVLLNEVPRLLISSVLKLRYVG